MNKNSLFTSLLLFVVLFTAQPAVAQFDVNIFFWDNDNNLTQADPVLGGNKSATAALTETLDDLGYEFDLNSRLPSAEDLMDYDLVMTALSFYCPG